MWGVARLAGQAGGGQPGRLAIVRFVTVVVAVSCPVRISVSACAGRGDQPLLPNPYAIPMQTYKRVQRGKCTYVCVHVFTRLK